MPRLFSIIIPVYNRPEETDELLQSMTRQTYTGDYEIVIVEDGSQRSSEDIVKKYRDGLRIKYLKKENEGPGPARNFGMKNASGDYFIILDSDVILPPLYLQSVYDALEKNYTDAYGGPDRAMESFGTFLKSVNYSMTSVLTTGGLRGHKKNKNFQLRSFNMGLSKKAFKQTGGFDRRRTGEDIELTYRLKDAGFSMQYLEDAYVYHKRRTNIRAFFRQTYSFGKARRRLIRERGEPVSPVYLFPTIFIFGFVLAMLLAFLGFPYLLWAFVFYAVLLFVHSTLVNKSLAVGFISVLTTWVQFAGYGLGFFVESFRRGE